VKLRPEQLASHLAEGPLAPVYLVSGDEPLLVAEAADAIRAAARAAGFDERHVLHVETGFDWSALAGEGNALSLFAQRRLLELRLPSAKPGEAGARALRDYCAHPNPDTLLLVTAPKLDRQATASRWYKAIDAVGVTLAVWPVGARELPGWIARRLQARGLHADPQAIQLLAERVEGNLLAAAQEIEKLTILAPDGRITPRLVEEAVADSARMDAFQLNEALLAGDAARALRILRVLRETGEEPVKIAWAVQREITLLARLADLAGRRLPRGEILKALRLWEARLRPLEAALPRLRPRLPRLVARAARLDRVAKGQEAGNPWDELVQLALEFSPHTGRNAHGKRRSTTHANGG